MLEEFIEELDKAFDEILTEKTSWGRNDLKLAFEKAKNKASLRLIRRQKSG